MEGIYQVVFYISIILLLITAIMSLINSVAAMMLFEMASEDGEDSPDWPEADLRLAASKDYYISCCHSVIVCLMCLLHSLSVGSIS